MPEKEQWHPGHRQEEAGTLANMPNFSSCLRLASFTDKFPLGGGLCSVVLPSALDVSVCGRGREEETG